MQVDALIKELLQSSSMNEDTTADLNRMLGEFTAGTLHADDAVYIAALHARLNNAPLPEIEPEAAAAPDLDGLSTGEWRDRAIAAEAELAPLKAGPPPAAN